MEQKYSIEEILSAVNDIGKNKKEKKVKFDKDKSALKDYSAVPNNTLKLIEEAEKIKN